MTLQQYREQKGAHNTRLEWSLAQETYIRKAQNLSNPCCNDGFSNRMSIGGNPEI